jgi:hypothetical protein
MALSKILPASQEQYAGARNLIINGACAISQRGDVTGVTSGYGGADRFGFSRSGAAAVTLSQDTDVPSNQGFTSSQKVDVTTADNSLAANDYALVRHSIEAQNLQHLLYGTSGAKKLTLQFWVKSPKTGVHIIEFVHSDAGYYNSQSYTIATADTWQKVTMTFDGYQTTAINNDNGIGITIHWWLAAGSTYAGGTLSENTWQNTNANRAAGQVNVMDDATNNFYLTGVQLEVGEATPFEHRSYGDELQRCQRYYSYLGKGTNTVLIGGYNAASSDDYSHLITYPVEMRASPTITKNGTWTVNNCNQPSTSFTDKKCTTFYVSTTGAGGWYSYAGGTDDYLEFDAEL